MVRGVVSRLRKFARVSARQHHNGLEHAHERQEAEQPGNVTEQRNEGDENVGEVREKEVKK